MLFPLIDIKLKFVWSISQYFPEVQKTSPSYFLFFFTHFAYELKVQKLPRITSFQLDKNQYSVQIEELVLVISWSQIDTTGQYRVFPKNGLMNLVCFLKQQYQIMEKLLMHPMPNVP